MRFLRTQHLLVGLVVLLGWAPADQATPSLAFDHIWIHVAPGAPEADALTNAGFQLPPGRPHTGLGTASTAVFFGNAYLELIWVEDPRALGQVAPDFARTLLGGPSATPFGIGLRLATDRDDLPFDTATISAEWIRTGTSIQVARRSSNGSADPPIFVVPRYMGYPEFQDDFADLAANSLELHDITRVRIHGPELSSTPPAIGNLTVPEFVQFVVAEHHLLELEFDGRAKNEALDLRPTLPLVIRY